MSGSDMDTSSDIECENQFVDYNEIAKEYRQANWSSPHNPFHKCFAAADKKEEKHSFENAFRSGPFKSLHVDIPKPKTDNKIIIPKSATANLTPEERNKILWESF